MKDFTSVESQSIVDSIARLWVLWNIRKITSDQFAMQIEKILKPSVNKAWQEYLKNGEAQQ